MLKTLLPLSGLGFRLTIIKEDTLLPPFKQVALTAFLRGLLDHPIDYERYLIPDIPEPSRLHYQTGDCFRFTLLAMPGEEALLRQVWEELKNLPFSAPLKDKRLSLRDNLRFGDCFNPFTAKAWSDTKNLPTLNWDDIQEEAALWQERTQYTLRLLTPTRLLRHKQERGGQKGELRFCRNNADLDQTLLEMRLHDALSNVIKGLGKPMPARVVETQGILKADVFWIDAEYYAKTGARKPVGGLMGKMDVTLSDPHPNVDWARLVLGQYIGIGQRRAFGLGRYRLETADGLATLARDRQQWSFLLPTTKSQNMLTAWQVIKDNQQASADEAPTEPDLDRLEQLAQDMLQRKYRPPQLSGWLHKQQNRKTRALAVPPFYDRVAQRAASQILSPYLDSTMYERSFGFRRGRSRFQARDQILRLYHQGYRWVFESDIEHFFDTVAWARLDTRLKALLGDDPLTRLLLSWMQVPVEYQGQIITRTQGLPQGAPLSPLLANLMLDDFDSDLCDAGCHLVRFADDFLILAKTEHQAKAASSLASQALQDLGLGLKSTKTRIVDFASGFRFLGFLFVNGMAIEAVSAAEQEEETDEETAGWLSHNRWRRPTPKRNSLISSCASRYR
jgi:group II intron reverse transcriptase/maturase